MKKRMVYAICFAVIFCIEVLIALYVRDSFVRPYVGDVLVIALVYSFVRIFLPTGIRRMPFYVFLFGCFVEAMQYFRLTEALDITNRAARIVLGATFDWKDIACYAMGCLLIFLFEKRIYGSIKNATHACCESDNTTNDRADASNFPFNRF